MRRHLLSIDDLSREDIERILGRAESFAEVVRARDQEGARRCAAAPSSTSSTRPRTRTSSSFELAAKRLSRRPRQRQVERLRRSTRASRSRTRSQTLSAYDPAAIVIRSPARRRRRRSSRAGRRASVINAGDGKHEHPTQALLDLYTLRAPGRLARGAAASGSSATSCTAASRARTSSPSRAWAAQVTVCGPPTLIPRGIEALGCEVRYDARRARRGRRGLRAADAARAHGRLVRALAARVRRAATRSTAAGCGPTSC